MGLSLSLLHGWKHTTAIDDQADDAYDGLNAWIGQVVTIKGVGGSICVDPQHEASVTTSHHSTVTFLVERAPAKFGRGFVAFRVLGTNRYLTAVLYGDEARQSAAEELGRMHILPDLLPHVVDYVAGRASTDANFEGAGYDYSPMTAQEGPPSLSQVFLLERRYDDDNRDIQLGVKSKFGTYWRSQHWDRTVSQSPHLLVDETWTFTAQDNPCY